jgi:hypothetical protein
MNITKITGFIMALSLASFVMAESVHQKVQGEVAFAPAGGSALEKNLIEVKSVPDAEEGKVARVKSDMNQWGFVSYWFGIPSPAGKSVLRIRIYLDDQPFAEYAAYTINPKGQNMLEKIKLPADAKPNTFVNVDLQVNADAEWSGVAIKKFEKTDKPGPWIDSISIVLP